MGGAGDVFAGLGRDAVAATGGDDAATLWRAAEGLATEASVRDVVGEAGFGETRWRAEGALAVVGDDLDGDDEAAEAVADAGGGADGDAARARFVGRARQVGLRRRLMEIVGLMTRSADAHLFWAI